jgi:scyllo-inositol 2-dehydrogenase (NADP+)
MKKIKVALVGYGSVGEKIHAPLIHENPELELTAVVERHASKSQEKYPQVKVFRSLEALLEARVADLVVIVTPNELHFPQAKMALESGLHVVVDKPVTVHSEEARQLDTLAKEKGKLLSVFQNRRLDGDFLTVKEILRQETLGRIVHFESHFDRFRPHLVNNWREKDLPGSGITYDLGTHLIDQAVVLFGKPEWVYAEILKQRTEAVVDDFFDITLMYPNLKVRLTASVMVNAPLPRFLVLGEKSSYSKYGLDVQEKAMKAGLPPSGENWGLEPEESWGKIFLENETKPFPTLRGDYRLFYQNITDAIHGRAPLQVKMEEAILVLEIIEAALKSHQEGRRIKLG